MLVITRRIGEIFNIGNDVEVHILGVKGCQVKIGISAPKHIAVHRSEVYKRIQDGEMKDDDKYNSI